jgi:alkyl hydroperoxide reductase subunit AhpC
MVNSIQKLGQWHQILLTIGVYKNQLRENSTYLIIMEKNMLVLIFYPANFTSVSPTELIRIK